MEKYKNVHILSKPAHRLRAQAEVTRGVKKVNKDLLTSAFSAPMGSTLEVFIEAKIKRVADIHLLHPWFICQTTPVS